LTIHSGNLRCALRCAVRWWQPFAWLAYPAAYAALALAVLNHAVGLGARALG
jgi:hypothetical protein